jgi:hypothetical protein
MAKSVATHWKVVVNGVDLSDHAFAVEGVDEKEKIDVSGFGGTKEYLPGVADQTVTVSFLNDRAASSVHHTLKPLYTGGSSFPFFVQPSSTAGTAADNELYGGSASMYMFPFGASLNEREEIEIEFSPATSDGFSWGTVAP